MSIFNICCIKLSISALLILLFNNPLYSQTASESTIMLLKYQSGSGGILLSSNNNLFHSASLGECIVGEALNLQYFHKAGFWRGGLLNPTKVENEHGLKIPIAFNLFQNFPNPFNPSTSIKYNLPEPSIVTLEVFNILGQKVIVLVNSESKDEGYHQIIWNSNDSYGSIVASGIYFYRIIFKDLKKMILLK